MFEDFLVMKLKEAAVAWAAQKNALQESKYLEDARQWARAQSHGAGVGSTPPKIPLVVAFEVVDNGIVEKPTTTPISSIKPESFLPTYGTDINAVGGGIGGPIPGMPGKFYALALSNPQAGAIHRQGGPVPDIYIYQRPTPFGGFWVKL